MSKLLKRINPEVSAYKDRRFDGDDVDWGRALRTSTTLYIGNLSFFTREEQIYEVFSKVGHVGRIVMGLDQQKKTPCGFAFVIYYTRPEAEAAVRFLNGTLLDERPIRVDHDWGFVDGRQWGRGNSGGQVRDEFRLDYDAGRGGFGKVMQREIESQFNSPAGIAGSPFPTGPSAKRQRVDGPRRNGAGGGGGGEGGGAAAAGNEGRGQGAQEAVEVNPRFRERERRRNESDEDDG